MHEDHRKRVRARFLAEGLDNFEPHNVLEFLLFYSIPRQDTNEIAHRLIDRFGGVASVFDADINELLTVDGIGENSAVLLKLIPQIARRYMLDKRTIGTNCKGLMLSAEFMRPYFTGRTDENVFIMFLDASFDVIGCELLFKGSVNSAHFNVRTIIERTISTRASMVVISHNHPGGVALASSADISSTRAIFQALELIDVRLLEHFIFVGDKYTPVLSTHLGHLAQSYGDSDLEYYYSH